MPIQVPTLNRSNQVVDAPSAGRITVNAPNIEQAGRPQTEAALNLVEAGAKAFDGAIDTKASEAATKYDVWWNEQFEGPNGVKYKDGDPTEVYSDFEKRAKEKRDEILNSSEYPSFTKDAIKQKLDHTNIKLSERQTSAYGKQLNDYQTKVDNDQLKIYQNDMIDGSSLVKVGDDASLTRIATAMDDIRNTILKRAVQNGQAKEIKDEQGNVISYKKDPIVDLKIAEKTSEGLKKSVENLAAANQPEAAKFLMEKYGGYIDAYSKPKLTASLNKVDERVTSYKEFDKIANLPEDKALPSIESIKDPIIREKVLDLYNGHNRKMQAIKDRQSDKNYNLAYESIAQRVRNGEIHSITELENDPIYRRAESGITKPKQIEALRNLVVQPKTSSQESEAKMQEMLFNGKFRELSPAQFNEMKLGLSKEDANKYENIYISAKNQTGAELERTYKQVGRELQDQMISIGYVKKDKFGRFSNEDQKKLIDARNELIQLEDTIKDLTPKERADYIKKFSASKKAKEVFVPPETPKMKTTLDDVTQPSKVPGVKKSAEQARELQQLYIQFRKEKGYVPNIYTAAGKAEILKFKESKK